MIRCTCTPHRRTHASDLLLLQCGLQGPLCHPARQRVWSFECLGLHVAAADSVALVLGRCRLRAQSPLAFGFPMVPQRVNLCNLEPRAVTNWVELVL